MAKKIYTKNAPEPIGPYSQGIEIDGVYYFSGQIPIDPENGSFCDGDVAIQTERVCKNISAVLKEAGLDFDNVVKTTCFLVNKADFTAFNEVYAKYFVSSPARSCVFVKELPKDSLVEIEVIAHK